MRKSLGNLFLLLISIVVSVVAAEVALRMVYEPDLSGSWRIYDQRGLRLNKSEGSFPHHGGGYSATYSFRYPHLRGSTANEGKFRILVLGESFTFGWLLNWPDTYVGRVESHIQTTFGPTVFELANAAVGGWGIDSYLAYLEGYGDEVNPDIVLVFLNIDDIRRANDNGLYLVDQRKLIASDRPIPFARKVIQALPFYGHLVSRSYLLDAVRSSYLALRYDGADGKLFEGPGMQNDETDTTTKKDIKAVTLARHIFERIIEWCRERDVTLIVVTTAWHNPPYDGNNANELFMAEASQFFGTRQVKFFDGSPLLIDRKQDLKSPIYIEEDGHPNEEGARLIAEINWPFLKAQLTEFCKLRRCLED
ncbi:MAG: SGNH/GDSL hydrolase family protein [Nitrososphaera sp.]|nr:SGNH/GDSL hydrolase family protein [Nitrososphaera sp.]